ncbi:hypothetical protein Tco_0946271 [Tanacetum coccineum]
MNELPCSTQYFEANNLPRSCRLVPSCFVIYDLELLSLSFDFVFLSEIFKSLSFRLDHLISLKEDLFEHEHVIQRISLTGFPAQSVGSSNTDVLDLPCLLVLITGTSQSRQHVLLLDIELTNLHLGTVFATEVFFASINATGMTASEKAVSSKQNPSDTRVGTTLPAGTVYSTMRKLYHYQSFIESTRGLNNNIFKTVSKSKLQNIEAATRNSASKDGQQQYHHSYMNGFDEPLPSSHSLLG